MPYVKQIARDAARTLPTNAGELNYALTCVVLDYMERNGPVKYELLNEIVGALESAKAEFQRRVVGPYEDRKRAENGDVYPDVRLGRQQVAVPAHWGDADFDAR